MVAFVKLANDTHNGRTVEVFDTQNTRASDSLLMRFAMEICASNPTMLVGSSICQRHLLLQSYVSKRLRSSLITS